MKQRIITGIIFTLGIAVFIAPGLKWPWISLLLFVFVAVTVTNELLNAVKAKDLLPNKFFTFIGSMTFLLPLLISGPVSSIDITNISFYSIATGMALTGFCLISIMTLNMIVPLLNKGPQDLPSMASGSLIMSYVAFPLSCSVLLLYYVPRGWYWLILALLTPWASDVFAYFTGSAIGKRHILPRISPKKTLEGCLGGVAGSMLIMVLYFQLVLSNLPGHKPDTWLHIIFALVSGIFLSLASQLGDWLASTIKRWCQIKDYGKILPGHGGILDRFDSAFFTMPVTLFLAMLYWQIF